MKPLLALMLAVSLAGGQTASPPNAESKALFGQIDSIMQGLSEITGWKVKRKVPADFITKRNLQHYVERRLHDMVKPEEIRIESLTLKMFGLVPEDFDLEKAIVELVTEQAAAFYDYNRKRLYITETSATFLEQRIALVHELAHALADQQFTLAKYIKHGNESDDDATAREAVMEGQATWLMWAYSSKLNGGDAEPSEIILDTMRGSGGAAGYPILDSAPLYLRESLVFPYNQGLLFQQAVYLKMGKQGFSEVYRRAPRTTAQIIHPAQYFENRLPPEIELPAAPAGYKRLAAGSVGEFDHKILLEQFVSKEEAAELAPHWRAGEFRLDEHKTTKRALLTYVTEWDTEASAKRWFDAARKIVEGKSKDLRFEKSGETVLTGANSRGRFEITLSGTRVMGREGL